MSRSHTRTRARTPRPLLPAQKWSQVLPSPNCAHPPATAAAAATGCVIEITIVEGRNRQVRRLMARAKLPLTKLTRVSIGPIQLGELEEGGVRCVTRHWLGVVAAPCRPRSTPAPQPLFREYDHK